MCMKINLTEEQMTLAERTSLLYHIRNTSPFKQFKTAYLEWKRPSYILICNVQESSHTFELTNITHCITVYNYVCALLCVKYISCFRCCCFFMLRAFDWHCHLSYPLTIKTLLLLLHKGLGKKSTFSVLSTENNMKLSEITDSLILFVNA